MILDCVCIWIWIFTIYTVLESVRTRKEAEEDLIQWNRGKSEAR